MSKAITAKDLITKVLAEDFTKLASNVSSLDTAQRESLHTLIGYIIAPATAPADATLIAQFKCKDIRPICEILLGTRVPSSKPTSWLGDMSTNATIPALQQGIRKAQDVLLREPMTFLPADPSARIKQLEHAQQILVQKKDQINAEKTELNDRVLPITTRYFRIYQDLLNTIDTAGLAFRTTLRETLAALRSDLDSDLSKNPALAASVATLKSLEDKFFGKGATGLDTSATREAIQKEVTIHQSRLDKSKLRHAYLSGPETSKAVLGWDSEITKYDTLIAQLKSTTYPSLGGSLLLRPTDPTDEWRTRIQAADLSIEAAESIRKFLAGHQKENGARLNIDEIYAALLGQFSYFGGIKDPIQFSMKLEQSLEEFKALKVQYKDDPAIYGDLVQEAIDQLDALYRMATSKSPVPDQTQIQLTLQKNQAFWKQKIVDQQKAIEILTESRDTTKLALELSERQGTAATASKPYGGDGEHVKLLALTLAADTARSDASAKSEEPTDAIKTQFAALTEEIRIAISIEAYKSKTWTTDYFGCGGDAFLGVNHHAENLTRGERADVIKKVMMERYAKLKDEHDKKVAADLLASTPLKMTSFDPSALDGSKPLGTTVYPSFVVKGPGPLSAQKPHPFAAKPKKDTAESKGAPKDVVVTALPVKIAQPKPAPAKSVSSGPLPVVTGSLKADLIEAARLFKNNDTAGGLEYFNKAFKTTTKETIYNQLLAAGGQKYFLVRSVCLNAGERCFQGTLEPVTTNAERADAIMAIKNI